MSQQRDNAAGKNHFPRVRLAEVAALASVDVSTVSRIVNGDPNQVARPETRQRIYDAVVELGYRPNVVARSLRRSTNDMYGLVIPDFSNPIYAQIIMGAETRAMAMGKHLFTSSAVDLGSEGYLELLGTGRIDGLLVSGETADVHEKLDRARVPWLFLNRRSPHRPRYVVLDDVGAARIAVGHLLQLGHERIAHISGPPTADTARRRKAGYVEEMNAAGWRPTKQDVIPSDYTNAGGANAMRQLAGSRRHFTAVFVASVASAIGVLWCAQHIGLRVPEDLSVIAIHDLPLASFLVPPLTTVRMPIAELGQRGVEILVAQPAGAVVEEIVSAPMELIVRASTGPVGKLH